MKINVYNVGRERYIAGVIIKDAYLKWCLWQWVCDKWKSTMSMWDLFQ